MNDVALALLSLHLVFLFATGLAFAAPLAVAGAESRARRKEERRHRGPESAWDSLGVLIDLWLLIEDCIPVFWLIGLLREAPDDAAAAKQKWREEPSIRWMFWTFLVLVLALPLHALPL